MSEQPMEEPEYRVPAIEIQPEIDALAKEPLKLAIQYNSIADAIQDILKDQEIDTSYLRQKKGKSKKKKHRHAYDSEMIKIKTVVSENLRCSVESVHASLPSI